MDAVIDECLSGGRVMQIATGGEHGPWICTVYFVALDRKVYWLSLPSRRHSQDIAQNPRVAVAIAYKLDQPVVGVQAEGTVEQVQDSQEVRAVMDAYVKKYGVGNSFTKNFQAGTNKHVLYRFDVSRIHLFDERPAG